MVLMSLEDPSSPGSLLQLVIQNLEARTTRWGRKPGEESFKHSRSTREPDSLVSLVSSTLKPKGSHISSFRRTSFKAFTTSSYKTVITFLTQSVTTLLVKTLFLLVTTIQNSFSRSTHFCCLEVGGEAAEVRRPSKGVEEGEAVRHQG